MKVISQNGCFTENEIEIKIDREIQRLLEQISQYLASKFNEFELSHQILENIDYKKEKYALVEWHPKTGRTHQIRVHMSFLGWPIFADEKYLNKSQFAQDTTHLQHHFLHARKIEFKKEDGSHVSVEAPLPQDCSDLLAELETKNS